MFAIEALSLHSVCAAGNNQQETTAKWAAHTSVVEMTIRLLKTKGTIGDLFGHIFYGEQENIPIYHPCRTKVMNSFPCVNPGEQLLSSAPGSLSKKMKL